MNAFSVVKKRQSRYSCGVDVQILGAGVPSQPHTHTLGKATPVSRRSERPRVVLLRRNLLTSTLNTLSAGTTRGFFAFWRTPAREGGDR